MNKSIHLRFSDAHRRSLRPVLLLVFLGACSDEETTELASADVGSFIQTDGGTPDAPMGAEGGTDAAMLPATDAGMLPGEDAGMLSDGGTAQCRAGTYNEVLSLSGPEGVYEQRVRLYVPAGRDPGAPVIMQLHGANGSIARMVEVTGLEQVADTEGFLVVTPLGFTTGPGETSGVWNSGPPFSNIATIDHVSALERVVDELAALTGCGEGAPVFVAGQSNGAMMAYRLACEASPRFDGVVISAGYLGNRSGRPGGQTAFECEPERALPLLHIHGLQDPLVPFDGNMFTGQPGIEDNVADWRMRYRCAEQGTDTTEGPVRRRSWSCEDGVPIEFITIADHGHPWAGSPEETITGGNLQGPRTESLSATAELVRFVRAHAGRN